MCGNVDILPHEKGAESEVVPTGSAPVTDQGIVSRLNAALLKYEPKFIPVTERLENGIYTRFGTFKAGEIIIGAVHRRENFLHISKGKIAIWDNLTGFRVVSAPYTEESKPGMRRIGIALQDTEGCNIFQTGAATTEQAEAEMVHPFIMPANPGELVVMLANETGVKLFLTDENKA